MDGDGTPKAAFHFQELLDKIQNSPVDFTDPCSVGPGFFETALAVPVSIPVKAFQASLRRAEQEFPIEVVILRRVVEFPKIAVFTLRIQIADQLPLEQEGFSRVGLRAIAGIGPGQNPGDVAVESPKAVYGVVKGNGPAACPANVDRYGTTAPLQDLGLIGFSRVHLFLVGVQNLFPSVHEIFFNPSDIFIRQFRVRFDFHCMAKRF